MLHGPYFENHQRQLLTYFQLFLSGVFPLPLRIVSPKSIYLQAKNRQSDQTMVAWLKSGLLYFWALIYFC